MKSRIFRGAIRPPIWLGMPFLFGLIWAFSGFLLLLYILVIFNDNPKVMGIGVFIALLIYFIIFVLVRDITKKDPYRLRQIWLYFLLRAEQGNFGKRGEFVYVPYSSKKLESKKKR